LRVKGIRRSLSVPSMSHCRPCTVCTPSASARRPFLWRLCVPLNDRRTIPPSDSPPRKWGKRREPRTRSHKRSSDARTRFRLLLSFWSRATAYVRSRLRPPQVASATRYQLCMTGLPQ